MSATRDDLGQPRLTVTTRLERGPILGHGTESPYRGLVARPGESHLRRLDLAPGAGIPTHRESLLHFAHITDVHILETASPGRFEFAQRFHGPEELHYLLPSYRPQESLQLHAVEAMLRTLASVGGSPLTGSPIQFLICTGDLTDNSQTNELEIALSVFRGGTVSLWEGGAAGEGVESAEWDDVHYWHPGSRPDAYKGRWGFPAYEGLLEEAARGVEAQGFELPWLACFGNHDGLVLGAALHTDEYETIVTGAEKTLFFPLGFDPLEHIELFIHHPERFLAGPRAPVALNAARRASSRSEFVRAHLAIGGTPFGHGFSPANRHEGRTYYVEDRFEPVRLIVLDSVNLAGDYRGSVGVRQAAWLEERLAEVHSHYWDARGRLVETGNDDRLVVIASHHPLVTLINGRAHPEHESDVPRLLLTEMEELLHRFPNVILWINGHTHRNAVYPRSDASGRTAGFWEVTTSSLIDWPCQARLVELLSNDDGTLSILCTAVDHAGPADPSEAGGLLRLASIHRELAANDPFSGGVPAREGDALDRNVELVITEPFQLM